MKQSLSKRVDKFLASVFHKTRYFKVSHPPLGIQNARHTIFRLKNGEWQFKTKFQGQEVWMPHSDLRHYEIPMSRLCTSKRLCNILKHQFGYYGFKIKEYNKSDIFLEEL